MLVGIALWLGPFIKRFGRAYAADVFHDNPQTGKSYIVLTDIVYYLNFAAYILFTVNFESRTTSGGHGAQVKLEVIRIGGILLIIGALHGLNIVLMPVLGPTVLAQTGSCRAPTSGDVQASTTPTSETDVITNSVGCTPRKPLSTPARNTPPVQPMPQASMRPAVLTLPSRSCAGVTCWR